MKTNHFPGSNNLIGFNHVAGEKCNKQCDDAKCVTAELCFAGTGMSLLGHWLCPCAARHLHGAASLHPLALLQCSKWGTGDRGQALKSSFELMVRSPVLLLAVLWEGFLATDIHCSRLVFKSVFHMVRTTNQCQK